MESTAAGYELLDAGDGRRLERFGTIVLDRPAPATSGSARRDPSAWDGATARFERPQGGPGRWEPAGAPPERWTVAIDGMAFELRPTPAGHVGLFPEHLSVASWGAARAQALATAAGRPAAVLNLFAYTGLATLVLARTGARVAHVDASRPAVAWARRNADLSGLADRPIRWLVEDAARYVDREARRGRRYDGVLLDPPTYGHGPDGTAWGLASDLVPLLVAVRAVLEARWFVACTAHASGLPLGALEGLVRDGLGVGPGSTVGRVLSPVARSGARLPAGLAVMAEWGPRGGRG